MNALKWTKSYDLRVKNQHFRVFVSEHEGNGFYASCLWYEPDRMLKAPGQAGALKFDLEKRFATTEADALEHILQWVKDKFGEKFQLTGSK